MRSYGDRLFPVTLRGAAAAGIGVLTTVLGVVRVELAALTWGSVLLLLCLYAVVAGLIFRRLVQASLRRGASVRLISTQESPPAIHGRLDLTAPVRRPPGFRARHLLTLRWDGGRVLSAVTPLPRGRRSVRVQIPNPPRGLFAGGPGVIQIADLFGLTRFGVRLEGDLEAVVSPEAAGSAGIARERTAGGEPLPDQPRRDRNDELLEVRRYLPGDDLRRLSWKHYAHVGELLLRIGEEIPPPNQEVVCVLVPGATRAGGDPRDLADALAVRFATVVAELDRAGVTAIPVIAPQSTPNADSGPLERRLSDFRITDAPVPSVALKRNQTVVIVAAAGSAAAEALAARLSATTARVHHLEVRLADPHPERRPLLHRVLLKGSGASAAPDAAREGAVSDQGDVTERRAAGWEPALVILLRAGALLFLALHYRSFVSELLSIPFAVASLALAMMVAYGLAGTRLRLPWTLLVGAAAPWAVRLIFSALFAAEQGLIDSPAVDAQNLVFDANFLASLPIYYVAWVLTQWVAGSPRRGRWEPLMHGVVLVAVFWTQAHYQLSFYDHPSLYAVALTGFVVLELLLFLAVSRRAAPREREPLRRDLLSFAWLVIPLLAVFVIFVLGRYTEGSLAAGGGLIRPTLFRFDFSQYVTLESEISMNDDLVLLYRRSGRPKRELLRRFVLSGYDTNRGFFHDPRAGLSEQPVTVPDGRRSYQIPPLKSRVPIEQDYFLVNFDPTSLLALNEPVEVVPYQEWDNSSFSRAYSVTSMVSDIFAYELVVQKRPEMDDAFEAYYTDYGGREAIAQLAREVTKESTGYYQQVKEVEQYLLNNYYYSLKPGIASDGDQLSHFLFTSRKGYCSYFAFSMALMLRSLDIPARVAVGFFIDPTQEVLNFYPISAQMAHAWVEVYFGDLGWIEFDPTSQEPAPDEEFEFSFGADRDELQSLLEEILNAELIEREPDATATEDLTAVHRSPVRLADIPLILWYLLLPGLYLIAMAVQKRGGDLYALLTRDHRAACRARYRSFSRRLAAVGFGRRAGESFQEYAVRLEAAGVHGAPLNRLVERAMFAPDFEDSDRVQFDAAMTDAERSLTAAVGQWRRLIGLLNPAAPLVRGHVEVPL